MANPDGCGAAVTDCCLAGGRVCDVLNVRIVTQCIDTTVKMFLQAHDPANDQSAWPAESFEFKCKVTPLPLHCETRGPVTIELKCEAGTWNCYFNGSQMTRNKANCNPVDMEFERSPPFDCVADGVAVLITE